MDLSEVYVAIDEDYEVGRYYIELATEEEYRSQRGTVVTMPVHLFDMMTQATKTFDMMQRYLNSLYNSACSDYDAVRSKSDIASEFCDVVEIHPATLDYADYRGIPVYGEDD